MSAFDELGYALERLGEAILRQWAAGYTAGRRFTDPPPRVVLWGGRPDVDFQLDSDDDAERADRMDAEARARRRLREARVTFGINMERATASMRAFDASMRRLSAQVRSWSRTPAARQLADLGRALEADRGAQAREARYLLGRELYVALAIKRGRYLEPGRIARLLAHLEELELDVDPLELLLAATDVHVDPEAVVYVLQHLEDAQA